MAQHGDPSFRQKLGDNARRMRQCIVVQKIPGPTFLCTAQQQWSVQVDHDFLTCHSIIGIHGVFTVHNKTWT
jgi:hypothetical protein